MKTLIEQFKLLMITYDIELVELMSGGAAIAWGIWLLNPAFMTFTASPSYLFMANIASEETWGCIMLTLGLIQVFSVISHRLRARKISAITSTMLWIFITSIIAFSNLASTSVGVYAIFAAFNMWGYLRLSQRVDITSKFNNE